MDTDYYIITGTSKGLGASLSKLLLNKNSHVYCLSRTENRVIEKYSRNNEYHYSFHSINLSDLEGTKRLIDDILTEISVDNAKSITLINNAAIVPPIKYVQDCQSEEIISNLHLTSCLQL